MTTRPVPQQRKLKPRAMRRDPPDPLPECALCGQGFVPYRPWQRFCSRAHRHQWHTEARLRGYAQMRPYEQKQEVQT